MNKYLVEFIGTFFLVLTIGCTVISPGAQNLAPLAIGASLMVMIFAGAHVSGAHYNPAVTLGVWLRGKCPTKDVLPYWISQVLAAVSAGLVVRFLKSGSSVTPGNLATIPTLIAEFLFTFALVYVVLHVATAKDTAGNSFYGLAIGMTVMTGAFAVGNVSGGAFNPAVAVGLSVLGLATWSSMWIFWLAEIVAAVAAALVFGVVDPASREAGKEVTATFDAATLKSQTQAR